ncbi:unnamed protein product, partial [Prorocentrum cordatum]
MSSSSSLSSPLPLPSPRPPPAAAARRPPGGVLADFDPNFFCELAYEGFNPTRRRRDPFGQRPDDPGADTLLRERNILDCLEVHVSRTEGSQARGAVHLDGGHGLRRRLARLRAAARRGVALPGRAVGPADAAPARVHREQGQRGTAARSFELWDQEMGQLVAGDLGYTLGGVYVSQTGFRREGTAGAGEVQLVLTAALLHKMGHSWFDLGQARTYKDRLGARRHTRQEWLRRFHAARDEPCRLERQAAAAPGAELVEHLVRA